MGDKFFNDWNNAIIVKLVDEKEKKGNGLILLKDIIELRPCCRIYIANLREYDFIDVYKHPEEYAVTDMKIDGDYLLLLIKNVEYV
jgi:hypothetical protein